MKPAFRSAVWRTAALVAVLAVAAAGCGGNEEGEVVARVNSSTLTVEEFYASVPEQLLAVMSLNDQEEALRTWVKTELFYQEALRRGVGEDVALQRRLREIERELVAEECVKQYMDEIPEVTEVDARIYFESHKNDYGIQVRLAHILVRSEAEAERAHGQSTAGTPFETVAAMASIDQTASLGGDLGYMRRGDMIHELEEPAFSLKVGEVSDVIPSNYGYHIVKVLDRHPGAGQPSFDSKRAAVLNFLTSERRRRAFDDWLVSLEERARVVIDTARVREAARARMEEKAGEGSFGEGEYAPVDSTGGEAP